MMIAIMVETWERGCEGYVCIKIHLDLCGEARVVTHKEKACNYIACRNHDDWDVHLELECMGLLNRKPRTLCFRD